LSVLERENKLSKGEIEGDYQLKIEKKVSQ